jgi:hypothetical protein
MFDVRSGPVPHMLSMEPNGAVTIFAAEVVDFIADRVRHRHLNPFPSLFVTALEELLYLALIDPLVGPYRHSDSRPS